MGNEQFAFPPESVARSPFTHCSQSPTEAHQMVQSNGIPSSERDSQTASLVKTTAKSSSSVSTFCAHVRPQPCTSRNTHNRAGVWCTTFWSRGVVAAEVSHILSQQAMHQANEAARHSPCMQESEELFELRWHDLPVIG